jgi:hypothetical protein
LVILQILHFHKTLDSGLQKIATTINSSKHTTHENHESVMKGMKNLVTEVDIRKAGDAISGPAKQLKIIHAMSTPYWILSLR